MSTDVTKVVFRWRVPELHGKGPAEALTFFRTYLREPDEIDDGSDDCWFGYEVGKGKAEGVRDFVRVVHADKVWGLELVLGRRDVDSYRATGFMPEVLDGVGIYVGELMTQLNLAGFDYGRLIVGKVHAYTWYNGVDEPVTFD